MFAHVTSTSQLQRLGPHRADLPSRTQRIVSFKCLESRAQVCKVPWMVQMASRLRPGARYGCSIYYRQRYRFCCCFYDNAQLTTLTNLKNFPHLYYDQPNFYTNPVHDAPYCQHLLHSASLFQVLEEVPKAPESCLCDLLPLPLLPLPPLLYFEDLLQKF